MDAEVLIVGAGVAGLGAALRLTAAGRTVRVLEHGDTPGGRMRSDRVGGFVVDRGFQVLNTAYSELQRLRVLDQLDLRVFDRGAFLASGRRRTMVADPRLLPAGAIGLVTGPLGGLRDRARLGAYLLEAGYRRTPERNSGAVSLLEHLRRRGLRGAPVEQVLRPFLAGVLLEDDLRTSARFARYVLRTFVRGRVVVPDRGMGELPRLLAARLPDGALTLSAGVARVRPGAVDLVAGGTMTAREVIVAADPVRGSELLGLPAPAMHAVTTVWHATDRPPTRRPMLAIDADGGPLVNSVVMTNAAPGYAADGRALVASSSLGPEPLPDAVLRRALARLWGVDVAGWEEVAVTRVPRALPDLPAGSPLVRPARLAEGLLVAGDWRATPSTQGALASGRRAAEAVLAR